MQKNANSIYSTLFTKDFIDKLKNVLISFYSYESYMDFIIIPTITGRKILSYIPIVSYTDRSTEDIEDLLELAKENEYQIRVLNFQYQNFSKNDTVTMRLDIEGKKSEEVFMECMKSKHRKTVKSSIKKNNFTVKKGNDTKSIDNFYKIFTYLMHKHGTPAYDKKLFYLLSEELKEHIWFYNIFDHDEVIASYCLFIDKDIAYGAMGGFYEQYRHTLVGHFSYWHIIKDICDTQNLKIFDFGRSPYESGGYTFKHRFGAIPVKIDILSSQNDDIYSKYSLASSVWKKMPKGFVDLLGPKLCRYLVDL